MEPIEPTKKCQDGNHKWIGIVGFYISSGTPGQEKEVPGFFQCQTCGIKQDEWPVTGRNE